MTKVGSNGLARRRLETRRGPIHFPAYVPVTTFGDKYPLDNLIRPYLSRLAPAVMVSYHYARQMGEPTRVPLLVDSGGFASLLPRSSIVNEEGLGVLEFARGQSVERAHPKDILELQERLADVAFTLDFPIPPGLAGPEATSRLRLTIANARWALANRRRRDLPLYAAVQGWDPNSFRTCARELATEPFEGFAIGGLVPRAKDLSLVLEIVRVVRQEVGPRPLHVFGLGKPNIANDVLTAGADSVDSSSYVKLAADGKLWTDPSFELKDPSPTDRLHLALCNLAAATGRTLPLSASGIVFKTHALASQEPERTER